MTHSPFATWLVSASLPHRAGNVAVGTSPSLRLQGETGKTSSSQIHRKGFIGPGWLRCPSPGWWSRVRGWCQDTSHCPHCSHAQGDWVGKAGKGLLVAVLQVSRADLQHIHELMFSWKEGFSWSPFLSKTRRRYACQVEGVTLEGMRM